MLFMFESTMAKSRLKTLTELRRVRVDGQTLMVHRCGKYVITASILSFFYCFSTGLQILCADFGIMWIIGG